MNYFRQLRAFRIRKKLCQLTAPDIALWFALMSIGNELGQYDRLSLSESTLMEEAGISRSSLNRVRNKLQQLGFIRWKSRGGNRSALYSVTELVLQYETQTETQNEAQTETQSEAQSETIYKLNGMEQNDSKKACYNSAWRTSARARAAVAQNLIDGWESIKNNVAALNGLDANATLCKYLEVGMAPEQIKVVLKNCELPRFLDNHLFTEAVHLGIVKEDSSLCPQGY